VLFNTVELAIPLLLAALGGLYSEKTGMLNISLEGLILSSAFAAFAGAELSGSLFVGVLAAVICALFLGQVFALGTLVLKGNIYVVGLAVNLAAYPLTSSLSRLFFKQGGSLRAQSFEPPLRYGYAWQSGHPLRGLFLGHNVFMLLSLAAVLFTWFFFRFTYKGLEMELSGSSEERLKQKGGDPLRTRYQALWLNSLFCGLSGAALSLTLGSFIPSMSAGKGWIALILIYLGRKKVGWIALSALFFALMESLSIQAQGLLPWPPSLLLSLPYFITLFALGALQWRSQKKSNSFLT